MMRSMYAGVSGLRVHQTKMDVIGNNIANVNTTGFKGSRVSFKSMMSQIIRGAKSPQNNRGGVNAQQVGLGVNIGSIDTNMKQGNLQSTGMGTDLAIQGNGFFIVNDGQQNLYTRAGALSLDENGKLVNASNGYVMQGWMADDSGNIDTNQTMEGLQIPIGKSMSGEKTTETNFGGNLDGRKLGGESRIATIDVFDSIGEKHTMTVNFERQLGDKVKSIINLDSGNMTANLTPSPQSTTDTATLDELKLLNGLKIEFGENINPANEEDSVTAEYNKNDNIITLSGDWDGSSSSLTPAGPGVPSISQIQTAINNKIMDNVDGLGSDLNKLNDPVQLSGAPDVADLEDAPDLVLESASNNWNWEVTDVTGADVTSIVGNGEVTFNNNGTYETMNPGTAVSFDPTGPATMGEVKMDFSNLTQSAAQYTVDGIKADGYEMGSLETFNISSAGIINGTFSNGLSQSLGQLSTSSFSNASGLNKIGSSLYAESQNSGMARIGTAGIGGRGEISAGKLEMSNVDLSKQFTEMITTQRGFQANSKIITTTDQMLQELVNLKR